VLCITGYFEFLTLKALALKARLISAMGEAHGLDIQSYFRVLAGVMPIGKISFRQNE
jgi:hypothetical protein